MDKLSIIERDTLYFMEEGIDDDRVFYTRRGRLQTLATTIGCDASELRAAIKKLTKLGYIDKVEGGYYLCA